jgi:hypothetical protein
LLVEAVLREKKLGSGGFEVEAGQPTLVEIPVEATAQGVVRVTLFSARQEPLAERLVYHGMGADLKIALTADRKAYSPRDPVKLRVRTTDASGKPVKANVGVAVVDERTVMRRRKRTSSRSSRARARCDRRGSDRRTQLLLRRQARGAGRDGRAARDARLRDSNGGRARRPPPRPMTTIAAGPRGGTGRSGAAPVMDAAEPTPCPTSKPRPGRRSASWRQARRQACCATVALVPAQRPFDNNGLTGDREAEERRHRGVSPPALR